MKDVILEARKAKGMSQQELADLVGVTQPTVCLWETGKCLPSVPVIRQLSRALDVPVERFFSDTEAS